MGSKTKLVILALILLQTFAGQAFWTTLADIFATYANVPIMLTDKNPAANNTNNTPPQPASTSSYTVINYLNGTKVTVFTHVDPNTLPPNATMSVVTTVILSTKTEISDSVSANLRIINLHIPFWTALENASETMKDINDEISFTLICMFCIFELRKNFSKLHPPFLGK